MRVWWSSASVFISNDGVTVHAGMCLMGADNTTRNMAAGSNLCTGPQDCVLKDRLRSDPAVSPDYNTALQFRVWRNFCRRMNRLWPLRFVHERRPPFVFQNRPVNLQVIGSRSDVEPLTLIEY